MDTVRATERRSSSTAVWAITPGGIRLGQTLCTRLAEAVLLLPDSAGEDRIHCPHRRFGRLSDAVRERFHHHDFHVFIFATGIAARILAPLLISKTRDPGVVVMDEAGQFAISFLSGHLGGGNELAQRVARAIGAVPVITTATDVNDLPSMDMVAKKRNLVIETPENIRRVNMSILRGEPLTIEDPDRHLSGALSGALVKRAEDPSSAQVFCSHRTGEVSRETLVLRPQILSVGIGCNRGTQASEILGLLRGEFKKQGWSLLSIKEIGTSEVKRAETGLLEAAKKLNKRMAFYSAEALNGVESVENPSEMAEKHLGVKSVCEAAAILGANKGPLLIPKQKTRNVTLAVARLI